MPPMITRRALFELVNCLSETGTREALTAALNQSRSDADHEVGMTVAKELSTIYDARREYIDEYREAHAGWEDFLASLNAIGQGKVGLVGIRTQNGCKHVLILSEDLSRIVTWLLCVGE